MQEHAAHAALSSLNHLLAGADWARVRLQPFAGRTLRLALPPLELRLVVDAAGYFAASPAAYFDVSIELPTGALRAAWAARDSAEGRLRGARIEGDAEFAQGVGFVLQHLRWDYEEDLSHFIGDIAARRLVMQAGAWMRWQRDAVERLAENVAEYLVEERPWWAATPHLQSFSDDLQALSAALDALEQRWPDHRVST
ncbi:MAG: hypothetical protein KBD60_06805 [Sterolibacterium sp.]|jgi:ubiquinone biosynthesis protein UbiJ|nr:hypothetical protein [Sterolibacterium sp.]